MIDDQKLVYETALELAKRSSPSQKNVLIVEGGPGTGKSVVAINLLVELTNRRALVKYVTKNATPRYVYESKLTGVFKSRELAICLPAPGVYTETPANTLMLLSSMKRIASPRSQGCFKISARIRSRS